MSGEYRCLYVSGRIVLNSQLKAVKDYKTNADY